MLKKRPLLAIVTIAIALASSGLRAQDNGEAVTLAFKNDPGPARRFRVETKGDMTLTPEGGAGGLGPIPFSMKSALVFTEQVNSGQAGVAALAVTPLSVVMDTSVMGMNSSVKMQGGKVEVTMNGQPAPPNARGAVSGLITGKPINVQRNARGEITGIPGAASGMGQMLGSSYILKLPEKAVKVGDTWESALKVQPSLPGGGAMQIKMPEVEIKFTHTLKGLETKDGHQHAVIESVGSGATSEATNKLTMQQKYTGTTRFDTVTGSVLSGSYTNDLKMTVGFQLGGAPGGAAPAGQQTIRIDGLMTFGLAEVPNVPDPVTAAPPATKPAAVKKPIAKKPAPKKPVVKKKK